MLAHFAFPQHNTIQWNVELFAIIITENHACNYLYIP